MRVCVYCASSRGIDQRYADTARDVGTQLAARGIGLVYGGAKVGLMGTCADAALAAGGEVVGVIPAGLETREVAHRGLSALHVTGSMHERKQKMHDLSDGFLTLPGGFGTMDELFETLTWGLLGIHHKPIVLLDVAGYYRHLVSFMNEQLRSGLLQPTHHALLRVTDTVEAALDDLVARQPSPAPASISDVAP